MPKVVSLHYILTTAGNKTTCTKYGKSFCAIIMVRATILLRLLYSLGIVDVPLSQYDMYTHKRAAPAEASL